MEYDPIDPEHVLPQIVRRWASEAPGDVFLVDVEHGSIAVGDFQSRVMKWAYLLSSRGVGAGDRVATMFRPSIEASAVWLACSWLGALEVPINTAYVASMLAHVVNDSGAGIAVCQSRFVTHLDDVADMVPSLGRVIVAGSGPGLREAGGDEAFTPASHLEFEYASNLLDHMCSDVPMVEPMPWDVAAVMYTSGTTGPSKGVLVPWGQLATAIDAFDDCTTRDVLYAPFDPAHLAGKLPLQLMAYWRGRHVFRQDGFKTGEFWNDVRQQGCTRVWLFYAMANFLWRQPEQDNDRDNTIESITGGPLLAEYLEFERRFGVKMRTNFGMTEAGWPIVTGDRVVDNASCGRRRAGYELRIVDEHDRVVPVGQVGELILRSDKPWTMNLGYFNRPEATAEAWRNGWFHTGDGFRADSDGNLYFVDRIKDVVRRRGENISSFEVESIVGEHEAVLESAAYGVPSEFGEEELKISVVPLAGQQISALDLADFLVPRMPAFMVPRYIEIVATLPKTPTGRVKKFMLKDEPFTHATLDRESGRVIR